MNGRDVQLHGISTVLLVHVLNQLDISGVVELELDDQAFFLCDISTILLENLLHLLDILRVGELELDNQAFPIRRFCTVRGW